MTPYTKQIVELHKIHKAIENCGCNKDDEQGGGDENSGNLLMSLIPNDCPKPDLFLYQKTPADNPIDVTNYKIDDLINLYEEEQQSEIYIMCLYESSTLSAPIISNINFSLGESINLSIFAARSRITNNEVVYNNKTYYFYFEELI